MLDQPNRSRTLKNPNSKPKAKHDSKAENNPDDRLTIYTISKVYSFQILSSLPVKHIHPSRIVTVFQLKLFQIYRIPHKYLTPIRTHVETLLN